MPRTFKPIKPRLGIESNEDWMFSPSGFVCHLEGFLRDHLVPAQVVHLPGQSNLLWSTGKITPYPSRNPEDDCFDAYEANRRALIDFWNFCVTLAMKDYAPTAPRHVIVGVFSGKVHPIFDPFLGQPRPDSPDAIRERARTERDRWLEQFGCDPESIALRDDMGTFSLDWHAQPPWGGNFLNAERWPYGVSDPQHPNVILRKWDVVQEPIPATAATEFPIRLRDLICALSFVEYDGRQRIDRLQSKST